MIRVTWQMTADDNPASMVFHQGSEPQHLFKNDVPFPTDFYNRLAYLIHVRKWHRVDVEQVAYEDLTRYELAKELADHFMQIGEFNYIKSSDHDTIIDKDDVNDPASLKDAIEFARIARAFNSYIDKEDQYLIERAIDIYKSMDTMPRDDAWSENSELMEHMMKLIDEDYEA